MAWGEKQPRNPQQAKRNQQDIKSRIARAGQTRQTEQKAAQVVRNRKNNAGNN